MRTSSLVVLLSVMPLVALGQEATSGGVSVNGGEWSTATGRTVGRGGDVITAEVGWPGIEGKYLHGLSDRFDVGARFAFLYGTMVGVSVDPTFTFGAVMRAGLVRNGIVSLGLSFNPGVGFSMKDAGAFIVQFPLEVQVGVHPVNILNVDFGVGLTPTIVVPFSSSLGVGLAMPILFGPGVELFLTRSVMVTLQTRFGPGIWTRDVPHVQFSFVANFGFAYRF
jgi:hypothetical protein